MKKSPPKTHQISTFGPLTISICGISEKWHHVAVRCLHLRGPKYHGAEWKIIRVGVPRGDPFIYRAGASSPPSGGRSGGGLGRALSEPINRAGSDSYVLMRACEHVLTQDKDRLALRGRQEAGLQVVDIVISDILPVEVYHLNSLINVSEIADTSKPALT
jgi:hypothetical protein